MNGKKFRLLVCRSIGVWAQKTLEDPATPMIYLNAM